MSTPEKNLTDRDYERVLSSVRSDARKIQEALNRMHDDMRKLQPNHPASAGILSDCIVTMRLGLRCLSDVFKVSF